MQRDGNEARDRTQDPGNQAAGATHGDARDRPRYRAGSRGGTAYEEPAVEQSAAEEPKARQIEPNRVAVERRAGEDRRVAALPVDTERRMAERRAAEKQAGIEARERRTYVVGRVTQGVDYLFYLLYGLLGIRFVLALLGASGQAAFVQFVNGLTQPFYGPFAGIVARPAVNGGVLDFPLLIAVLAYALLHMAVRGLLRLVAGTRPVP
jgi:uncharacterized protein YggT (Ycf19 family)